MLQYIARLFGRPKKAFTEYAFRQVDFTLRDDGVVQYAQWLHPGEFGNEAIHRAASAAGSILSSTLPA